MAHGANISLSSLVIITLSVSEISCVWKKQSNTQTPRDYQAKSATLRRGVDTAERHTDHGRHESRTLSADEAGIL